MPAEEARAVHDVGAALADQRGEVRQFFRRVLEIGILDGDQIARHFLEATPQRGALPAVPGLQDQLIGRAAASRWRMSRVPSVDPSSTMISSVRIGTARTRVTISSIVARSLKHGHDDRQERIGQGALDP